MPKRHWRSFVAVFATVLIFVSINARWIWLFRCGQPLGIDEAGYLSIALTEYLDLIHGGVAGWGHAVMTVGGFQAPLTTALASLLYAVSGPHIIVAFLIPLLAGAATVVATFCLGECLGSRRVGLIACILVASSPAMVMYSKSFLFAMPATATTTVTLLALIRSERFRHIIWSAVFGVSLGLMPLARTMTISFLPGIVLGALIYVIVESSSRLPRLLVLTGSLFLAAATAATWYWQNAPIVFQYLTSYGYGAHSAEYGDPRYTLLNALLSLQPWCRLAQDFLFYELLPHCAVIIAGVVAFILIAVLTISRIGIRASLLAGLQSKALPLCVFVLIALAAMASSPNKGSAFLVPAVPVILTLAAWSLDGLCAWRPYRTATAALAIATAILAFAPQLDLTLSIARPWIVNVPGVGPARITDGRGDTQISVLAVLLWRFPDRLATSEVVQPVSRSDNKAWVDLNGETLSRIAKVAGGSGVTALGFRHILYNINTMNLQSLRDRGRPLAAVFVDPFVSGDSASGYVSWLTTGEARLACLLLTASGDAGEIPPPVTSAFVEQAARQAGFAPVDNWSTPDSRLVTLWRRDRGEPQCSASPQVSPL
jgi:hypothetical protein